MANKLFWAYKYVTYVQFAYCNILWIIVLFIHKIYGDETMFDRPLDKEVDKLLAEQAKVDEKAEYLINRFLKENEKTEIYNLIEVIHNSGAPKHIQEIDDFKDNYEKNNLSPKDLKSYLILLNLHKEKIKNSNANIDKDGGHE